MHTHSSTYLGTHFQASLSAQIRRENGVHYTSDENILNVVNPLFMDELRIKPKKSLTFFDPACGCGNFLVVAYRELRLLGIDPNLEDFYGIEIDESAAKTASNALLHIQRQMGGNATGMPNIVCANALQINWNDVLPSNRCSYILSNPPFIGGKLQSKSQKEDMRRVFQNVKRRGLLDYAACWLFKSAEYMHNTNISAGFVVTNSITQGEQVGILWPEMFKLNMKIQFAKQAFIWKSEAKSQARVHCVIVGFSSSESKKQSKKQKILYQENGKKVSVNNINPYLIEAPDTVVMSRNTPICDVPHLRMGNQPIDKGYLLFTEPQKENFLEKEPKAAPFFRQWVGGEEFLNGQKRYCLWLGDCTPEQLQQLPECRKRLDAVAKYRLASRSRVTRELAKTPSRFNFENMPDKPFLLIPSCSSEKRRYIPIGFASPTIFASNATLILRDATLFHFGILTSEMHNDWMRCVCGRLESRYRYSAKIVYNNFPWPINAEKHEIEAAAKAVIDARNEYADKNLADLYNPNSMPKSLLEAHRFLDRNVEKAYRIKKFSSAHDRVGFLFQLIRADKMCQ